MKDQRLINIPQDFPTTGLKVRPWDHQGPWKTTVFSLAPWFFGPISFRQLYPTPLLGGHTSPSEVEFIPLRTLGVDSTTLARPTRTTQSLTVPNTYLERVLTIKGKKKTDSEHTYAITSRLQLLTLYCIFLITDLALSLPIHPIF